MFFGEKMIEVASPSFPKKIRVFQIGNSTYARLDGRVWDLIGV